MDERLRLLESVVVNANDVILISEAEPINEPGPRIIYVNEAFTRMTGYTADEVRNQTPRILQGKKTQRSELDKIRHALENWESVRVELINYRKDGSEFWVEINLNPVADEQGCYTHWIAIQREVTERKLAEKQFRTQILRSQLFADISLKIRQSLQLEDILKTTAIELQKLLEADRVVILRFKAPGNLYVIEETVNPELDSVIDQAYLDECSDEEYFIKYLQERLCGIFNLDKLDGRQYLLEFLRQVQDQSNLAIPLLSQERLWGVIVIHRCFPSRNWSTWEIDLLTQIADQIAIALSQSNLVKALANFGQNLKHLHRINTTDYQNFDDLFSDCLTTGCSMFAMSTGVIGQIKGKSYIVQAVRSQLECLEVGLESCLKDTYCTAVVQEKRTITYPRVGDIESMQNNPVYQNLQLESYIGTPIYVNGEIYGTLNFSSTQPKTDNFEIQEIEAIELMAQSIGKFITAHQNELQRQEAEISLQKSQLRWATLAETAPVGIFLTDIEGNCYYVNQYWCKIAGITAEEAAGQGWTKTLHPEDRDRLFTEWQQAVQHNLSFSSESRFIDSNDKITWFYVNAIAETTSDGSIIGYIGTVTDITERLKIKEIKQALEQEKKMSELKLRFFSMASHEFRTPLSIITLATQILENSEPEWLNAKKIRNINRIKDSALKITQMLTDVLMLARAETEKLELQQKKFNLKQFCQDILEAIKTQMSEDCAISFVYEGYCNDEVYLDEKLLYSILMNLLSNAVKYSPQGQKVNFVVKLQAESVLFTIQDQGIGIPEDKQTHLFEAFCRGNNVGRIEGTGLGLAIVKRYVDLQGGTIICDSKPQKGTTFVIAIPFNLQDSIVVN
ncbi:PAS domain S-box [Xenococcus sp. PCC 7305]|uniref:PAS domain S-box protein n=1 Tax=Xenococcus sp. PCC 7305 TaxID=102125 RepID=UPI0002AD138A|nr:PAS domain S-box protein [Xenococcus sp. PCC 7305]ELS00384.1 PAS domain S-box [Xenococcus sp. PCC 7305]